MTRAHTTAGVARTSTLSRPTPHYHRTLVDRLVPNREQLARILAHCSATPDLVHLVVLWDLHSPAIAERIRRRSFAEKLTTKTDGAATRFAAICFPVESISAPNHAILAFAETATCALTPGAIAECLQSKFLALKKTTLNSLTAETILSGLKDHSTVWSPVQDSLTVEYTSAKNLATHRTKMLLSAPSHRLLSRIALVGKHHLRSFLDFLVHHAKTAFLTAIKSVERSFHVATSVLLLVMTVTADAAFRRLTSAADVDVLAPSLSATKAKSKRPCACAYVRLL